MVKTIEIVVKMMGDFGLQPKAARKEREVEYRYRLKSEKTYEKYKFKEERAKYRKAKRSAQDDLGDEDAYGDMFGVYTADDFAQKQKDDESEGSSCTPSAKDGILKVLYKAFRGVSRRCRSTSVWGGRKLYGSHPSSTKLKSLAENHRQKVRIEVEGVHVHNVLPPSAHHVHDDPRDHDPALGSTCVTSDAVRSRHFTSCPLIGFQCWCCWCTS